MPDKFSPRDVRVGERYLRHYPNCSWPRLISQQSKQAPGQWPRPSISCPSPCCPHDRCHSDDLPKVAVISLPWSLTLLWEPMAWSRTKALEKLLSLSPALPNLMGPWRKGGHCSPEWGFLCPWSQGEAGPGQDSDSECLLWVVPTVGQTWLAACFRQKLSLSLP